MTPDPPENPSQREKRDKSVICPSCRNKLSLIAKYCPICGNELLEE